MPNPETFTLTLDKKAKISSKGDLAKLVAPKAVQILYNILSIGPRVVLRSAFQILRANTITRILSAVVLISIDTVSLIRKRISLKQYIINLILAIMLLVGGTAGWILGNEAVSILIENVILSFMAGLAGAGILGGVLAKGWEKISKKFATSDTEDMLNICSRVFADLGEEYTLSEEEVLEVKSMLKLKSKNLSEMFAQKDRPAYARSLLEPCVRSVKRRHA